MTEVSPLGPIDPTSVKNTQEEETEAPWIVRKLVGSMTGRIVMSSYESLRAAGTNIICLSPWGDSSPLFLPCIRFRDVVVHTVVVATGGMAAVAAPVMGPVSSVVVGTLGESIFVKLGVSAGFELSTKLANDLVFAKPLNKLLALHSDRLETTGIKTLLITLQYKHTMEDAALGFYRSSVHKDPSLFAAVKDYLAVEKGWFSPYLFASGRRPVIPRSMKADVIFCHGPFLSGDYQIGERLLAESALVIALCDEPPKESEPGPETASEKKREEKGTEESPGHRSRLSLSKFPKLANLFNKGETHEGEPQLAAIPAPPQPRRLVLLLVGITPHRKMWSLSARPGESVINYILLNGAPAVVLPAKVGAPLVSWDALTLEQLWEVELPKEDGTPSTSGKFEGIVGVLFEYLDLCVDWERVVVPKGVEDDDPKERLKDAISLLLAAAIRSKDSKQVRDDIDKERAGLVIWRIR